MKLIRVLGAALVLLSFFDAHAAVSGTQQPFVSSDSGVSGTFTACKNSLAAKPAGTYHCVSDSPVTVVAACSTTPPAPDSQPGVCPAGTQGSFVQSRAYKKAAAPTCWIPYAAWTPVKPPPGACTSIPQPLPTDGFVSCSVEDALCVMPAGIPGFTVMYGAGPAPSRWATMHFTASTLCSNAVFGDPIVNQKKSCFMKADPPSQQDMGGMLPIDKTKIPAPATTGIQSGTQIFASPKNPDGTTSQAYAPTVSDIGAFREPCTFSHMLFDDPIVYPGKPGVSHLHTFFGPPLTDANTTTATIRGPAMLAGGTTCAGGSGANNTAYWVPAMVDSKGNVPIAPASILTYYKGSYLIPNADIVALPVGMKMITGNAKNTSPMADHVRYICNGVNGENPGWKGNLALAAADLSCTQVGADLVMEVTFPICWDGVNVDSPSHNSHVSDTEQYKVMDPDGIHASYPSRCPASHPMHLPTISYNVHYVVTDPTFVSRLRLSSDVDMNLPAGYSGHGDYDMGWNPVVMQTFITNCLLKLMDCHAYVLGDGTYLK